MHVFTFTCLWLIVVITGAGVDRTINLTVVSLCSILVVLVDRLVVKSPAVVAFRTDGSTVIVEFRADTAVMMNLDVLFVFYSHSLTR